jgi:hypothetical protein
MVTVVKKDVSLDFTVQTVHIAASVQTMVHAIPKPANVFVTPDGKDVVAIKSAVLSVMAADARRSATVRGILHATTSLANATVLLAWLHLLATDTVQLVCMERIAPMCVTVQIMLHVTM